MKYEMYYNSNYYNYAMVVYACISLQFAFTRYMHLFNNFLSLFLDCLSLYVNNFFKLQHILLTSQDGYED